MFEPLPLNETTLRSLLAVGCEHAELDFKRSCDLTVQRNVLEMAKDVGAFSIRGGYIVVGATDRGELQHELTAAHTLLFDESRLRAKLSSYLAGGELRSQHLEVDGAHVAIVCVLPHPDGWAVMQINGVHQEEGGRERFVFRAGDVFARHGSSSERWSQEDAHAVRLAIARREAARARAELREEFASLLAAGATAQTAARAPARTLTLDMDDALLTDTVIEQLRAGDTIPLRLLLQGVATRVLQEATRETGDVDAILDRLLSLAALFVTLDREAEFAQAVDAFSRVYDSIVIGPYGQDRTDLALHADDLRFRIVTRMYALGALLVRSGNWSDVRRITSIKPAAVAHDDYWSNWLLHGDVMAARAGLHGNPDDPSREYRSTLLYAQEHVARLPSLRPDISADDDRVITSLCQFSFLACLVAIDTAPAINRDPFLPQFAVFPESHTDPIAGQVVADDDLRQAVFSGSPGALAAAYRLIGEHSGKMRRGFMNRWEWYQDPRVLAFLEQHQDRPAP